MFKKIVSHTVKFVLHTLKFMPVAATGLGLGIVNIGILLSLFLNSIIPSVVGLVICLLFISKIFLKNVLHFRHFISELRNPLVASFIPTISMAIMSMAVVVAYFSIDVARYVWYFGFVLHILLLMSFIYHCITVFDLKRIVPSWFVPPIGLVVASVSGVPLGFQEIAQVVFVFGFTVLFCLMPIVLYRIIFSRMIKRQVMPTFGIIGAPINLCLAGYLTAFDNLNPLLLNFLVNLGVSTTALVYISFFYLRQLAFTPLFASYTFPLAVGAIAMFKYSQYLAKQGLEYSQLFYYISLFETVVACFIISYVLYKLLGHIYDVIVKEHSSDAI